MLHLYNFLLHCKSCSIRTCYSQFRKKTRVLVFQRVCARVQGRRCGGGMARWSFEKIVFFLNLTFLLFSATARPCNVAVSSASVRCPAHTQTRDACPTPPPNFPPRWCLSKERGTLPPTRDIDFLVLNSLSLSNKIVSEFSWLSWKKKFEWKATSSGCGDCAHRH